MSDALTPRPLGQSAPFGRVVHDVAVIERFAYVVAGDAGLHVVDVSDPADPHSVSSLPIDAATSVAIAGTHAYVTAGQPCGVGAREDAQPCASQLWMIDISSPASAHAVGRIATPGWARDVAVSGRYAYVAAGDRANLAGGLRVIDVSDPGVPRLVGSLDLGGVRGLVVVGPYAYVAANGVRVIDISDPTRPYLVGSLERPPYEDLAVVDGYIYVKGGYCDVGVCSSWIEVIDVTDAAAPQEARTVAPEAGRTGRAMSRGIAVVNGLTYLATETGLEIWELSTPDEWSLVGTVETVGPVYDVSVAGGVASVVDGDHRLHVLDVRDPATGVALSTAFR